MLGKQIESLRRKKGWSQAELAQRLHVSASSVGMYEQGRREPSIALLVALSNELDVTVDYLVTGHVYAMTDSKVKTQVDLVMDSFSTLASLSCQDLLTLLVSKGIHP